MTLLMSIVKDILMPTLVGVVLYGNLEEFKIRYILSFAIILTCYHFMQVCTPLLPSKLNPINEFSQTLR